MFPLVRLIAWRYLFASRERLVKFLAGVALSGILLSVASLILVLSLLRGFQTELNRRWIGLNAHLTVTPFSAGEGAAGKAGRKLLAALKAWPEISEWSPFADGEVIVQAAEEGGPPAMAAKLRGIENLSPASKKHLNLFPDGEIFSAAGDAIGGEDLLSSLGIGMGAGDRLVLTYPFGEIGPTGDYVPTQKTFHVSHSFRTGIYEWDAYRLLVPLPQALALLGEQAETGLMIYLKDGLQLTAIQKKISTSGLLPPGSKITTFAEQNQRLFAALQKERLAMTVILVLFVLIATFSVVGLLLLFIDAKHRDLAILRAIGLPLRGARLLFWSLGGWLGGIGSLLGGALGIAVCLVLQHYPIRLPATYYLDFLPVEISLGTTIAILITGLVLALLSATYPVRVASKMEILEMLREE